MWYVSQISCMSPYSMPLWTIFTKWPAPFSPTQSQHGSPLSVCAQIFWKISFTSGHAAGLPPGIMLGPINAPSSPPETPVPMYRRPLDSRYCVRRVVSGKWLLPPSMMMSPGSISGINSSMKSSTGWPALTISMTLCGRFRLAISSLMLCAPMMFLPLPRPFTKSSTLLTVRLKQATVNPLLSMFRIRFSPMTARPIRPMSACCIVGS